MLTLFWCIPDGVPLPAVASPICVELGYHPHPGKAWTHPYIRQPCHDMLGKVCPETSVLPGTESMSPEAPTQ